MLCRAKTKLVSVLFSQIGKGISRAHPIDGSIIVFREDGRRQGESKGHHCSPR